MGSDLPETALIEKRNEFAGVGCAIQGGGLLAGAVLAIAFGLVGWVLGLVVAVIGIIVGAVKATTWVCGNCRNRVVDRKVRVCPACRSHLRY